MKTEIKMPTININDDSVTLISWLVPDGDPIIEGQPICEVETSKAIEEVLSPANGIIKIFQKPGDVATGAIIAYLMSDTALHENESVRPSGAVETTPDSAMQDQETRFTKTALAMLKEHHISESIFYGKCLIRSADVAKYMAGEAKPADAKMGSAFSTAPENRRLSPSKRRAEMRTGRTIDEVSSHIYGTHVTGHDDPSISISKRKREEIRVLSEGHLNALPSVLTQMVDVTGLQRYLASLSDTVTITFASIVSYEASRLLTTFKEFNATFTNQGINYHEQIHIGMAIDGPNGLKVAAIQNTDEKSIVEISTEMETLLEQYLADRLTRDVLTSATFNITDLTSFNIPWFTPLISRNQCAILGLGIVQMGDRDWLSLTLTFDHRVTEGKRAAEFLQALKTRVTSYVLAAGVTKSPPEDAYAEQATCSRCTRSVEEIPGDNKLLIQVMSANGKSAWMCKPCIEGW